MSYSPPSKTNWHSTGYFTDYYAEYYDKGYTDAKLDMDFSYPLEESGHERDTTFSDELNFWYYCGYSDYECKAQS